MSNPLYILGISAYYHDSAAALLVDGKLVAAAQEERFSRKKQDATFPSQAIKYCLDEGGIDMDELTAIAFYDKPLLKLERLLETYYAFAPRGLRSFLQAMPVWMREKMFLKREMRQELRELGMSKKSKVPFLFPEHHLSHAAGSFYASGYEEAAILTMDGVGEWATASICLGKGSDIKVLRELHFPHSLGLLYSAFTYFLGFKVNSGEYKLMGLAPYGIANSEEVTTYCELIENKLLRIQEDGSIWLNPKYFSYATSLRMIPHAPWEKLFGLQLRQPDSDLCQQHCNLALAIQKVTEKIVLKMAAEAKRLTDCDKLCLSGGVALNCVANGKLSESALFSELFIQPAAGDAGGAAGAAWAAHYIHFKQSRPLDKPVMPTAFLGPSFSEKEIQRVLRKHAGVVEYYEDENELTAKVAGLLANSHVVGWFQGRMEYGPRALGNRSILADPRDRDMQQTLNLKIKFRESFRPFAPMVMHEYVRDYFDLKEAASPYMLMVSPVHSYQPPIDDSVSMSERIKQVQSDVPAVTHVDGSARIQTVKKSDNSRVYALLCAFHRITDCPVLVNTSFNVRGEPIVCTPQEAFDCFMNTGMDILVLENFVVYKPTS